MGTIYGYVRVSSVGQHEDRQLIALRQMQIPEKNIYTDKQSGRSFDRPGYLKLMRRITEGDLMVIKSIDRLGRNYTEILEQWRRITLKKRADICVIDMPLLDTRREKSLLGTFISDLVLTLLSYVAENERISIRERQAEGIAAAKARGVRFGRSPKPVPDNFGEICMRWKRGELSVSQAAKECKMPQTTFFEKAKLQNQNARTK